MKLIFYAFSLSFVLFSCNKKEQPLYREISSSESGIIFNNFITESNAMNAINNDYLYFGGGVGVGDFNNDGLTDIFLVGNMVPSKLYLNKGKLKFEDITLQSGISTNNPWNNGVSVVDINNDGLLDIYISSLKVNLNSPKKNLLYINQKSKNGVPIFKEMAEEYGLAETSSINMANFFDYDNDGDLDVFQLVNQFNQDVNVVLPIINDGTAPSTDKLYQNNWDSTLNHPVFTDVSKKAGIIFDGFGLGVNIVDINEDGWKDIYISNDYVSNNLLYINNKNGTFSNKAATYFKHTSRHAMGNDAADINNDGLVDIIELDMSPEDNQRIKMMYAMNSYDFKQKMGEMGYIRQNIHNTLQLNGGYKVLENDSIGEPVFSEIAYFSGVAQTDWSWAPLLIDVDNDGFRDLMVTNGLPKDIIDLDFMSYRKNSDPKTLIADVLDRIPSIKLSNYIYKNNGNSTFTDNTLKWGWQKPTFSAGMAYADLDNDGDVDIVINNTNMEVSLLENTLNEIKSDSTNYIRINLVGNNTNINGIGTKLHIYYQGKQQIYECNPYRGYLSSVENVAHFGIGKATTIDSIVVKWPNFKTQKLSNIKANQLLSINYEKAVTEKLANKSMYVNNTWFTNITKTTELNLISSEVNFVDFNVQRLIPRKLSQQGPSLASADFNGDGLADLIVGGGYPNNPTLYLQSSTGKFVQKSFLPKIKSRISDDMGICIFDADGDGVLDIYIAAGSNQNLPGSKDYTDKFYLNDGKANFKEITAAIPTNTTSKSCVKAADYDLDGDLDLFIGGRVLPGVYPQPVSSIILRNDSKKGNVVFTDVTDEIASTLKNFGLVCDATWTDINNDGLMDLIVVGEWLPISIFKNIGGKFSLVETNFASQNGWYNSIAAGDLDNDGDIDYVVGNFGKNSYYRTSDKHPISSYSKDFDDNGSYDAIFSNWLPSTPHGSLLEYPTASRDEIIRELSYLKNKFPNFSTYAKSTMSQVFTPDELNSSLKLSMHTFATSWVENKGNMQFEVHQLPLQAQLSNINGIVINDFDGDGNLDIALSTNDYGTSPMLGQNDAMNGLVLKGNGNGKFNPLTIMQSGLYIPFNGKALINTIVNNIPTLVATQNAGKVLLFKNKKYNGKVLKLNKNDVYAIIALKNGKKRKEEFTYGSSYLSQSLRFLLLNNNIKEVQIFDNKNQNRKFTN